MKKIIFTASVLCISLGTFFTVTYFSPQSHPLTLLKSNIESLASGEAGEGGYSCTVTSTCWNGSISCTGTSCKRGTGWVECNGKKTVC